MSINDQPDWDDREPFHVPELVMPFLNVKSVGGAYEDRDFAAGFQIGMIYGDLRTRQVSATTYLIYSNLASQVDLIAMNFGYRSDVLHDDNKWAQVGVTRVD